MKEMKITCDLCEKVNTADLSYELQLPMILIQKNKHSSILANKQTYLIDLCETCFEQANNAIGYLNDEDVAKIAPKIILMGLTNNKYYDDDERGC